jgi:hypothetical protein
LARRSTAAFFSLKPLFGAADFVAAAFLSAGFFFARFFGAAFFASLLGAAFFTPLAARFTLERDFAWLFFFEVFFEDGAMERDASAPPRRPEADLIFPLRETAAHVSHAPMRHDVTLTIFSDYV